MLQIKQHYIKCKKILLVREIQIIFHLNSKYIFSRILLLKLGFNIDYPLILAWGDYHHILFHHISFLPNPYFHFTMYTFIICIRYFKY